MILGERNVEAGAYCVEFETFKKIYQLLARMAGDYKKNFVLMQFTLPEEEDSEEFKEILIKSLRNSDCVTQNGKKFLILLVETTAKGSESIKSRIIAQLKRNLVRRINFEVEEVF